MGAIKVVKIALQSLAIILLMVGIAVTFAGMFTSAWQVATYSPENIHQHGLWVDCESPESQNVKTDSNLMCYFKFDKQVKEKKHQFTDWQIAVLCLLGSANFLAIISIIFSLIACCTPRFCTIPFAVFTFLTTIVSAAGLFLFYRWAHESENRIERINSVSVEQQYGSSFWLAVSGCIIYLFATFIAILCSVIVCVDGRNSHSSSSSPHKTWPKININTNTVV